MPGAGTHPADRLPVEASAIRRPYSPATETRCDCRHPESRCTSSGRRICIPCPSREKEHHFRPLDYPQPDRRGRGKNSIRASKVCLTPGDDPILRFRLTALDAVEQQERTTMERIKSYYCLFATNQIDRRRRERRAPKLPQ